MIFLLPSPITFLLRQEVLPLDITSSLHWNLSWCLWWERRCPGHQSPWNIIMVLVLIMCVWGGVGGSYDFILLSCFFSQIFPLWVFPLFFLSFYYLLDWKEKKKPKSFLSLHTWFKFIYLTIVFFLYWFCNHIHENKLSKKKRYGYVYLCTIHFTSINL